MELKNMTNRDILENLDKHHDRIDGAVDFLIELNAELLRRLVSQDNRIDKLEERIKKLEGKKVTVDRDMIDDLDGKIRKIRENDICQIAKRIKKLEDRYITPKEPVYVTREQTKVEPKKYF